jgi:anion-transporting  ArsA/GET3 family ATPase
MSAPTLSQLIEGAPLVVCLGPGGVGKTTTSAVLAMHQAAAGRRSLVLTIDPARRLADALGLSGLTNEPAEVGSFRKLHPDGTLSALMLDPTATFDRMIATLVSDPARRAAMLQNRFYRHMSRSLAGTLEYMAVERLHELSRDGRFDSIVLDTPPTTNALDFLEAPDRLADFFNEKIIRWFVPSHSGTWTSKLFDRAGSSVLSLLDRVAGESFVKETVGFFGAFSDLLGQFRSRGVEVGRRLRDPGTVFLIVCAPDPNRIAEAETIDRRLAEAGCRARAFVINRVDQPFLPEPGELQGSLERATALLGGEHVRERVRNFIDRLEALRRERASAAAVHAEVVERVRAYAAPRPVYVAPSVPTGQSPRAALLAIYLGLFAQAEGLSAEELASEEALAQPFTRSSNGS